MPPKNKQLGKENKASFTAKEVIALVQKITVKGFKVLIKKPLRNSFHSEVINSK